MALILDSLYEALKAAGAPEEQARAAAREVANYDNRLAHIERDLTVLKWMLGAVIAVQLGTLWMQWQIMSGLAELQARVAATDTRLGTIEGRLPTSVRANGAAAETHAGPLR